MGSVPGWYVWSKGTIIENYGAKRLIRKAVLPSTGWWGDIGYGVFRTCDDHADLTLVETDYFFSHPFPRDRRPPSWDAMIEENRGQHCMFYYK